MWEEMHSGREGKNTLVAATHEPGYGKDASAAPEVRSTSRTSTL